MKNKEYTFHFRGGKITVWALNYEQARILAQAEAIQKGWDYTIVNNIDINNLPKEFDFVSNINRLVDMYHAVETEDDYFVTSDGGCMWHFSKDEIHSRIRKGDYVIVEEE